MSKGWWIAIGVVIVGLIGFAAYWFWPVEDDEQDGDEKDEASITAVTNEGCTGKYIDTHTHFDEDDYVDLIIPRFQEHSVGCAIVFKAIEAQDIDDGLDMLGDLKDFTGYFLPFFNLDPETVENITEANLDKVVMDSPVVITGFGEYAFYQEPLVGDDLTKAPWPKLFEFATANDRWIMIHLTNTQESQLPAMLDQYPEARVIVHGTEIGPAKWKEWLVKYPNLYYTLDTANILRMGTTNLMFPGANPSDGTAEQFLADYAAKKDQLLANAVEQWKPVIEAAPTKVFWGTDVAAEWHFDEMVYDKLIELTEEFVAELPSELRDSYRYDNAAKAFGVSTAN